MHETLDLSSQSSAPVVHSVGYTRRTRPDILALDRSLGPARRTRRRLWLEMQERRRRRAFRAAVARQCNGYPSANAYRGLTPDLHLHLDNRMTIDRFVTAAELDAREARLRSGGGLRLACSGRLDPMKCAQDLVPLASALASMGAPFRLDIFGDGVLPDEILAAIGRRDLSARVHLHAPVDFAEVHVPWTRQKPDLFVSCHRQGDPSCAYIESLGCGLPIVGDANEMWEPLSRASGGGWSVPLGDVRSLANRIATLDRAAMARAARAATEFAVSHDFGSTIRGRMDHLAAVAARRPPHSP